MTGLELHFEKLLLSVSFQKNGMSCALFLTEKKIYPTVWPLLLRGPCSALDLKNASGITSSDLLALCLTVSKYRALHKKTDSYQ